MSLINKALKDLEDRQAYAGHDAIAANVRVAQRPSGPAPQWIFGALVLVVVAVTAGAAGWLFSRSAAPTGVAVPSAPLPQPVVVAAAQPVPVAPIAREAPVIAKPAAAASTAAIAAPPKAREREPVASQALARIPTPSAPKPARSPKADEKLLASAGSPVPVKTIAAPGLLKSPSGATGVGAPVETAVPEARLEKSVAPAQQSENLHRQAVLLVQQGNGIDARPLLRRALQANPSNGGARQLLASLLVESNSLAEAASLLREGTRLTPERSGLWMNLARLELEQGDTPAAMADLESGLPSAGADPAYHGFYAALLQRSQRHTDAVAHYVVALRGDPSMPNWLVGIAISFQALGRSAEAVEAFQRALDGGRLTGPLRAFVEDRIEQLRH